MSKKLDKLGLAVLHLNRVSVNCHHPEEHVAAMAAVWGALRKYAKDYKVKMNDLHEWDKRLRRKP
jgi:hypothetical protein